MDLKEEKGFVSSDELGTAEKLIAEAEKSGSLSFEEGEKLVEEKAETPPEEKAEGEKPGEGPAKFAETAEQNQQVVDHMAQAIERAKQELKHKTDLTDKEINDYIYQRFLTAGKRIQREVETRKALEQALEGYSPKDLISYHREMEAHPLIQAIRAGKKFKEVTGEGDDFAGDEELSPEAKRLAAIEQKLNGFISNIEQRRKLEDEKADLQKRAELEEQVDKQVSDEEKVLCEKYPLFGGWIKQVREMKKNGVDFIPPELEEILDTVERDEVTLTYAVKAYFADHGLPMLKKQAEKETIARLQKKAGQKSESGTVGKTIPPEIKFHDEGAVAEALVKSANL
jgi:hypothetical protein